MDIIEWFLRLIGKTPTADRVVFTNATVVDGISEWGRSRGIHKQDRRVSDFVKNIVEELGEIIEADKQGDEQGVIDGMNDIIIFSITEQDKYGYSANTTLKETLKEISSRTGRFSEAKGKWVKDTSPAAKARWYKAVYKKG